MVSYEFLNLTIEIYKPILKHCLELLHGDQNLNVDGFNNRWAADTESSFLICEPFVNTTGGMDRFIAIE